MCMALTLLLSAYADRKIGGATGDTLGAVCEIIETVPAVVLALAVQGGAR
jgi:cobalamin synthase